MISPDFASHFPSLLKIFQFSLDFLDSSFLPFPARSIRCRGSTVDRLSVCTLRSLAAPDSGEEHTLVPGGLWIALQNQRESRATRLRTDGHIPALGLALSFTSYEV